MESVPSEIVVYATNDDVRSAIEALTDIDKARLNKAGSVFYPGSNYSSSMDLLNEAVLRTMNGVEGKGRRWPLNVPFMAYLIKTMESLANDSRQSYENEHKIYMESMGTEAMSAEDVLSRDYQIQADSPGDVLEAMQARQELESQQEKDLEIINNAFKDDSEIQMILMGIKDGLSATEIREIAEMTLVAYQTAKRRYRRKIEKLFGDRRAQ